MISKGVSVVVPCFNEGRRIEKNLQLILCYLQKNFQNFELIAVDDGSFDDTGEKLKKIASKRENFKVITYRKNLGKGSAVIRGMELAEKEVVMFLDADLAIPIEELPKFIKEIEKGIDVVVASRFVKGLEIVKPVLWYRKLMEKIFRIIRKIIIGLEDIQDTQCGFKVFSRQAVLKISSKMTIRRFSFDAEMLFIAKKKGFRIKELPIRLQNPVESHIHLFLDPLNMFFDLFRIRINDLKGFYDK